jgi:hypothetical protein
MRARVVYLVAVIAFIMACSAPGWVSPDPVQAEPSPANTVRLEETPAGSIVPAPKISDRPEPGIGIVSALQSLHIREKASEKSPSLGILYHGEKVSLTGECSGVWARIRIPELGLVWVNGKFISGDTCGRTANE